MFRFQTIVNVRVQPFSLLLLAATLVPSELGAAMVAVPLADLSEKASLILVGTVVGQSSEAGAGGMVFTHSTMEVEDLIKGDAGVTVEVLTEGGALGQVAVQVPVEADFRVGERVVVFLERRSGDLRTVNRLQGKFRVVDGEVFRGTQSFGPLEEFLAAIRAAY